MKIFISWSGPHSLGVATALRDALPTLFNGISLFVSSEDIRKGKRWLVEVSKELEGSNLGIVCLTPDNLEAPWLHFETGALSKFLKESSVYTFLVGGLRSGDIEGPLSQFQHTLLEKEDMFKLITSINDAYGEAKLEAMRLRTIFDKFWWHEFEAAIGKLKPHNAKGEKRRGTEEMLYELIETTNQIARNLPSEDETKRRMMLESELNRRIEDEETYFKERGYLSRTVEQLTKELDKLRSIPTFSPGDSLRAAYIPTPQPFNVDSRLSPFIESALQDTNIRTYSQLIKLKESDLRQKGLDRSLIAQIVKHLDAFGLKLAPETNLY